MHCSKCGTQIAEGLDYCLYCGQKIEENSQTNTQSHQTPPTKEPIHNSKIRKGIKAYAKSINKGNLIATLVICFIVSITMTLITSTYSVATLNYIDGVDIETTTQNAPIWLTIIDIIITFMTGIISTFGISKAALRLSRKQNTRLKDIFTKPFNNIKNILLYYGFIILIIFAIIVIAFIPLINILLFSSLFILLIYFIPFFDILMIMCVDDEKNKPFNEMIKEALKLVRGHRVEYYAMLLSFIGWFILCIPTLGILYFYVLPYLRLSIVNMYRTWNNEETFTSEKQGISNIGIIVSTIVIYIVLTFSLITLILLTYNSTEIEPRDSITEETGFDDRKSANEFTLGTKNKITISKPEGYKEISVSSYGAYFTKEETTLNYDLNTYITSEEAYNQEIKTEKNYRYANSTYEDKEFTQTIKGNEVKALLTKETSPYGTTSYKLISTYPIDKTSSITVTLSSYKNELTENDLNKILNIK